MKPPSKGKTGELWFRDRVPGLLLGTATDRFAGWIGTIYTPGRYDERLQRRTRKIGGRSYATRVLPVESVQEYFRHFGVLELDFTFYSFLLSDEGSPNPSLHNLRRYREFLGDGDRVLLKAPQAVTARRLRRAGRPEENPGYLDADRFVRRFLEPAREMLGPHLAGILFQQEYDRKSDRVLPEILARELGGFLDAIPRLATYHWELRTEAYLVDPVLHVLAERQVGRVLSHWTWLPRLREQVERGRPVESGSRGPRLIRLLTPLRVRYAESYRQAYPFDRLVEGMLSRESLDEAVRIALETLEADREAIVIVNNRFGGSAPLVARELVEHLEGIRAREGEDPAT